MINWKEHFDHIYCLHYVKNEDRYERISKEFKRTGILDSGIFSWHMTVDSPLKDRMYSTLNVYADYASFFKLPGYADLMFNHYIVMKEAISLNYNRILMFEDDIMLLKDIQQIEKTITNTPNNINIILYDYFEYYKIKSHIQFGNFIKLSNDDGTYHSGAMYSIDHKTMIQYVSILEQAFHAIDNLWNVIDRDQITVAISEIPCGIQCPSKHAVSVHQTLDIYRNMGIDLDLYNYE